jgi:hypothetical protein
MLIILATLVRSAAFQVVAAGSVTLSVTTANPVVNQPVSFSGTDSVNPNGPVIVFDYNTPDCTHPAIDDQGPMTISGGVFSATFPGTDFPTAGTYSAVAKDVSVAPSVVSSCVAFTVTAGPPPASSATDWAVLSVSLSPPNPNVGDLVTFSMVVTALSSQGSFPQNFAAACQIDGVSCGGGSLTYPGPLGTPMTVSTQTPWIATAGTHTLVWGVATIPVGQDPNKSNNMKSITFTVAQSAPQQTTTASSTYSTSSQAPSDFQVNVSPSSQTVLQGETVSYSVNLVAVNGFSSQVSLSVSGLPSGANGVFSTPSGTPNFASTLTVILPGDVATGSYTLTVTGTGGGLSHVANLVLAVNAAATTQSSASSTETVASSTQTSSDLTSMIQQDQFLILAAVILLAAVIIAVALRGRRKPTQPTRPGATTGMVYCRKCGTQNPTANEFCATCGTKLH